MTSDKKIYSIIGVLSLAGYLWIGFHFFDDHHEELTVCLVKNLSGMPCPSCGITRAILLFINGNVGEALWVNPLGVLLFPLLVLIPVWIIYDMVLKKNSFATAYRRAEQHVSTKKGIYLPLIAIIIMNWIWNITKGI